MVTARHVVAARFLMGDGLFSMTEAAAVLGIIPSSDLDRALWSNIGTPSKELCPDWDLPKPAKRPAPMF